MNIAVFGTSVQGYSHIRANTECQDSLKQVKCDDGTIIMAVADGHGSKSCPFSKTGSQIAVNVFCAIMSEYVSNYAGSPEALLTFLNREGDTKVAQAIDTEWKERVYRNHRDNKRDMPLDENGDTDRSKIYSQYGTTLLGLMLANSFLFAFQIGDGDIVFTSSDRFEPVVCGDKILGVETHSLSKKDAWKKSITAVRRISYQEILPAMFLMSSDGFSNSYRNEAEFAKTCQEYFSMVNQHGPKAVKDSLKSWLSETSAMGCGDDITVLIAHYSDENGANNDNSECSDSLADKEHSEVKETAGNTTEETLVDATVETMEKYPTPQAETEVAPIE